ncbi:hypothetical protein FIC_00866 [Flavobacteriaceae bacterium 3519-10]|nr:hypothetical protein FIC_00866 [Flavobacteriaceae bacterium 3519-10]
MITKYLRIFAPLFVDRFGEAKTLTINIFRIFQQPH